MAASVLLWPAPTVAKDPEKEVCDKAVLHLGEGVERIRWPLRGFHHTDFLGIVVYRDGRARYLKGNGQGLCDLEPDSKITASQWLTVEERGLDLKFLDRWPENFVDDSEGTAEAGLIDDSTSIAYFSNRTTVVDHPAIGRGYHLSRLVIHTNKADKNRFIDLPPDRVFMSRHVNPFPLNLHGNYHPVGMAVIKGHTTRGLALSVYSFFEGRLQLLARTPWHGDRRGWLAFVSGHDLNRDGCPELAVVRDPQRGGTLEIWELRHEASADGTPFTLVKRAEAKGFSNHAYGTASTRISSIFDVDGDGDSELIVPDETRTALRVMSLKGGDLKEVHRVALPARAAHNLAFHVMYGERHALTLIVPLEDSTIRLVKIDVPGVPYKRSSESCAAAYNPNQASGRIQAD